jgi:hypothetical protein
MKASTKSEKNGGKGKKGALATEGRARRPWCRHGGETPRRPYHGEKGDNSGRTGWRRLRRSRRQTQSRNGGVVAELDVGGWSDGVRSRSACCCCCCCEWARERGGVWETELDGGGDGVQTRLGEGGPAVPRSKLAGAWPPHGVRALGRSGRRARARALAS